MILVDYWAKFNEIQRLNDVAMAFAVFGFLVLLAGITICLATNKNRIGRVAIIAFYIIELIVVTIWGVNAYRFSKLSKEWENRGETITSSYVVQDKRV